MAIDTREKRANVMGVGRPWMRSKHPTGTFDEQARINIGNAYGGNSLSATGLTILNYTRGLMRSMFRGLAR